MKELAIGIPTLIVCILPIYCTGYFLNRILGKNTYSLFNVDNFIMGIAGSFGLGAALFIAMFLGAAVLGELK